MLRLHPEAFQKRMGGRRQITSNAHTAAGPDDSWHGDGHETLRDKYGLPLRRPANEQKSVG
jgi:hypothetical protein